MRSGLEVVASHPGPFPTWMTCLRWIFDRQKIPMGSPKEAMIPCPDRYSAPNRAAAEFVHARRLIELTSDSFQQITLSLVGCISHGLKAKMGNTSVNRRQRAGTAV